MAKKGLGKGLDALFASDLNSPSTEVSASVETEVKIADIDPNKAQPRKLFFDDSLEELAESIRIHGILQPLALRRRENGRYQIIAGERRFRAAKRAGLTSVPAVIIDADDREVAELALIENLQREDLNPVEEAEGFKALLDEYNLTQEEAAERLGSRAQRSQTHLVSFLSPPAHSHISAKARSSAVTQKLFFRSPPRSRKKPQPSFMIII